MSLPWFRLYRELKDDPKVGLLDDSSFRVFIESLCWACEKADGQGGTGLTMENASWAYRRNVTVALHALIGNGMLALKPSGEIMVPKWEDRQKMSDSSAERVRKYREKKSVTLPVTLHVTGCNALEENRIYENRGDKINIPPSSVNGNGVDHPPNPQEPKQPVVLNPEQLRLRRLFRKRSTKPFSDKELKLWRKVTPIEETELVSIERYYAAKEGPGNKIYKMKSLATLLNRWEEAVDWAEQFKPSNCLA